MEQLWNKLLIELKENPRDFQTHLIRKSKSGIWFYAWAEDDVIYISNAKTHEPSSSISIPRKLTYPTFIKIYDVYQRRENGERVSKEASLITHDQVYWYALIYNCL